MPLLSESSKQKNEIRSIFLMRPLFSRRRHAPHHSSATSPIQHTPSNSLLFSILNRLLLFLTKHLRTSWKVNLGLLKDCKMDVQRAEMVLVKDFQDKWHMIPLKILRVHGEQESTPSTHSSASTPTQWKIFEFRQERFVWNEDMRMFETAHMSASDVLHAATTRNLIGLDPVTHRRRLIEYGPNTISFKKNKKWKRRLKEFRNSIYLIPLMCVLVWIYKSDWMVMTITLMLVYFSIIINMRDFLPSTSTVKALAKAYGSEVRVIRAGESFITGSASLVPGDLMEITGRMMMPCDAILLRGAVECEEQPITGDPTPTSKHAASLKRRDVLHSNLLIGGTFITKLKPPPNSSIVAVVIKTGYQSMKGGLIKQVLNAQRMALSHPYLNDVYTLLRIMILCGLSSLFILIVYMIANHSRLIARGFNWDNAFDTLIICSPPFLGIIYTIPLMAVKRRLRKKGIYIQNLYAIMKFGIVDMVCFDKTNTLTEHQYTLAGIMEAKDGKFSVPLPSVLGASAPTLAVMATCHSLSVVDGKILGDPVEVELFEESGFKMKKIPDLQGYAVARSNPDVTLHVAQTFPFNSKERKNGVLTLTPDPVYFVKGAPQTIAAICDPSTVPADLGNVLKEYGMMGNRIIAFAAKLMDSDRITDFTSSSVIHLNSLEKDMRFLGLFLLRNAPVSVNYEIRQLHEARIDTCIMTGDSIYTAAACAKDPLCRILPANGYVRHGTSKVISSFETSIEWESLTGHDFNVRDNDTNITMDSNCLSILRSGKDTPHKRYLYNRLIRRCRIFSDMLPMQKGEVVQDLCEDGATVAFVGDNLNDVYAFSRADVGLNVTNDAENITSTFSAQFACEQEDGIPISYLIRQSRCLLENVARAAKFTCIFFFLQMVILIQNNFSTFFSNPRVAWQVLQGFLLTVALATNKPLKKLKKSKPSGGILSKSFFFSVFFHVLIHTLLLTTVLEVLRHTDLYRTLIYQTVPEDMRIRPISWWDETRPAHICFENNILFIFSNFQFIASAIAIHFNCVHSHPLKNLFFFILAVLLILINLFIAFPFPFEHDGFFAWISVVYRPVSFIFSMLKGFTIEHGSMEVTYFIFRMVVFPFFLLVLGLTNGVELFFHFVQ